MVSARETKRHACTGFGGGQKTTAQQSWPRRIDVRVLHGRAGVIGEFVSAHFVRSKNFSEESYRILPFTG